MSHYSGLSRHQDFAPRSLTDCPPQIVVAHNCPRRRRTDWRSIANLEDISPVPDVTVDEARLADVCARYGIARLRVFGSVARGTPRRTARWTQPTTPRSPGSSPPVHGTGSCTAAG